MDETRLRAMMREEIALAVKTLAEQTYCSDPDSDDYSFDRAASSFDRYAYRGACEAADAERAENPFTEAATDAAVDPSVKAFVHAEVQNVLREMRDQFYLSGRQDDLNIGNRLDHLVSQRERYADE